MALVRLRVPVRSGCVESLESATAPSVLPAEVVVPAVGEMLPVVPVGAVDPVVPVVAPDDPVLPLAPVLPGAVAPVPALGDPVSLTGPEVPEVPEPFVGVVVESPPEPLTAGEPALAELVPVPVPVLRPDVPRARPCGLFLNLLVAPVAPVAPVAADVPVAPDVPVVPVLPAPLDAWELSDAPGDLGEPPSSADATPAVARTAAPMPNATANEPTRPT
jgi:hypothetical protein